VTARKKRAKKKRAAESETDTWPTDMIIDWCGTELSVVGWTEGGAPYGVPAEELERDEDETVFGAIDAWEVDVIVEDLHECLRGDVTNALPHHTRDERRAAHRSMPS
jgi:hypothetical protein